MVARCEMVKQVAKVVRSLKGLKHVRRILTVSTMKDGLLVTASNLIAMAYTYSSF